MDLNFTRDTTSGQEGLEVTPRIQALDNTLPIRVLKASRTIADLDDKIDISSEHVSEAIQYRTFDRTLWV
jgi:predicted ATPase with chaperone activity